jgi:hypothetical protein
MPPTKLNALPKMSRSSSGRVSELKRCEALVIIGSNCATSSREHTRADTRDHSRGNRQFVVVSGVGIVKCGQSLDIHASFSNPYLQEHVAVALNALRFIHE